MFDLFGNSQPTQSSFEYPPALFELYRPQTVSAFIGLSDAKDFCEDLIDNPKPSAWRFEGPSGTGKTTMALALAQAIPAEIHHIPSQNCNLETLERVCRTCQYVPAMGFKMHLALVDEADQMSPAAQLYLLSKLDGTAQLPNTIWIFTCNDTERLQDRFLSRTLPVKFSSHGIAAETTALLARIWEEQAPAGAEAPTFSRIVIDAKNNVRASLMSLELKLTLARRRALKAA